MSELYVVEGDAENWQEALKITASKLLKEGCVREDFYESCVAREKEYPTGLTETCPVAIPHTTKEHVKKQSICALRLHHPVVFKRMDDPEKNVEIKYVFNLALLNDSEHVEIIARVIQYLKDADALQELDKTSLEGMRILLKEKFFVNKGENQLCG